MRLVCYAGYLHSPQRQRHSLPVSMTWANHSCLHVNGPNIVLLRKQRSNTSCCWQHAHCRLRQSATRAQRSTSPNIVSAASVRDQAPMKGSTSKLWVPAKSVSSVAHVPEVDKACLKCLQGWQRCLCPPSQSWHLGRWPTWQNACNGSCRSPQHP